MARREAARDTMNLKVLRQAVPTTLWVKGDAAGLAFALLDEPVGRAGDLRDCVHAALNPLPFSPAWPEEAARRLTEAFLHADSPIEGGAGMSCGLGLLAEGVLFYALFGDVRAYLLRGDTRAWRSTDHSVAELTQVTGERLPPRPGGYEEIVTDSIGAHEAHPLEVARVPVQGKLKLLICTRRLHRYAREEAELAWMTARVSLLGEVIDPRGGLALSARTGLLAQGVYR